MQIDTRVLEEELFILQADKSINCRLIFKATFNKVEKLIPLKYSEYKRINVDGIDAWMIEATGIFKEDEESIKMAFIPIKNTSIFTAKILKTPSSLRNHIATFTEINE